MSKPISRPRVFRLLDGTDRVYRLLQLLCQKVGMMVIGISGFLLTLFILVVAIGLLILFKDGVIGVGIPAIIICHDGTASWNVKESVVS